MRKNISTQDLKTHVGEIVDSVRLRGDHYIIERRGKPVAAVVPAFVARNYEQKRKELFELMEKVAGKNREIPPEVIQQSIAQAIKETRQIKRARRRNA